MVGLFDDIIAVFSMPPNEMRYHTALLFHDACSNSVAVAILFTILHVASF